METYLMPLNKAHQQERKAEQFVGAGKFDDAIICHQRAADLLCKAVEMTSDPKAKQSLEIQHKHHTKMQDIIRLKANQSLQSSFTNGSRTIENIPTDLPPSPSEVDVSPSADTGNIAAALDHEVYRTIEECDSLLRYLQHRGTGNEDLSDGLKFRSNNNNHEMIKSGVKVPKNEQQVVEELRIHNDALREQVMVLLKENEEQKHLLQKSPEEVKRLQNQLDQVMLKSVLANSLESDHFHSFPAPKLDLPPLEMPKFNFDDLEKDDV